MIAVTHLAIVAAMVGWFAAVVVLAVAILTAGHDADLWGDQ